MLKVLAAGICAKRTNACINVMNYPNRLDRSGNDQTIYRDYLGRIDEPAHSVDELLSQLSSVDVVVSGRFHNLLLAMALGKPVMAISYHEKFQPLMNGVGLGENCQGIEHIEVDELIGKTLKLHENASDIELQIARETERYRVALDEQYQRILQLFSRPHRERLQNNVIR